MGGDKDTKKPSDTKTPGSGSTNTGPKKDRPKRESIIDLSKFLEKQIRVKFQGGRETSGKLKGFDQQLNLVLDDAIEYMKDSDETRKLGRVVCRGQAVTIVCPQDGHEIIQNPFLLEA